jgi:lipoprotein signal peptidase
MLSVAMYLKLKSIYFQHFKFAIALNLSISLFFLMLFISKGFDHYPLYMLMLFFKAGGYIIDVVVEKFFFAARSFHYKNMGFSYRKIFGILFATDFILLIMVILISYYAGTLY